MLSVSGCRGIVGESLTPETIARFAGSYGTWLRRRAMGKVRGVLGRDGRAGSEMVRAAAVSGLLASGCDVIDLGIAMTPTAGVMVQHHKADGGMVCTASHNPIEWNALKFIGSSGLFLSADEGREMRALVESGIPYATWDALGKTHFDGDAITRHLQQVLKPGTTVIITADHGNDPTSPSTDHSREYVPACVIRAGLKGGPLGDVDGMSAIGATVLDHLGIRSSVKGSVLTK